MADSDDDQDRGRGRDKFRRERSDYSSSGDRTRREKRTWRDDSDSYAGRRRSRDEFENEGRKRFSGGSSYGRGGRDWSPPAKRMRREQWSGFPVPGMLMPYGMRPPWSMPPHPAHQMSHGLSVNSGMGNDTSRSSKRGMLTFKQFLTQQEDDIEEADAITSYDKYKAEFKKKMVEEFFEEHKEEDWLISLYHPKKVKQNEEKEDSNLQSRVKAFSYLLECGLLESVSLSVDNSEQITKIMDSAVIKMEGGSDLDLLCLERPWTDRGEEQRDNKDKEDPPSFLTMEHTDESKKLTEQAKEYGRQRQLKEGSPGSGSSRGGMEEDKMRDPSTSAVKGSSSPAELHSAENGDESGDPKPRPLHITRSVYIRHIPAKIAAEDIMEVCQTIPGFMRLALAEPAPDKQYERRGWATYSSETDLKEVIARLTTTKIKDTLLSCMQNRDLNRRVKHCSTAAWARKALHTDLQHVIKLIKFLDEKVGLWEYASPSAEEGRAPQTNPVLSFSESLLEEEPISVAMGVDEEEGAISDPGTEIVEKSDDRLQLLDRLLWYLRIVHSLDYYTGTVFPSEDSMPHRCGLFTARAQTPDSLGHQEVSDYVDSMEEKVKPLFSKKESLSDAEIIKLGKKDPEAEVERFVELNTQKLAENKYLCPLSGKKFKGPEFVRKHIFNKHMDKVEAFKQEAEFFNHYIRDPNRPIPLETTITSSVMPSTPKTPGSDDSPTGGRVLGSGGSPWGQGRMGMYGRGGGFGGAMGGGFTPPNMMNRGSGGFRGRGGRRGRGRRVVNYQDLDAPEEMY